jgi:hypothetical protein
MGKVLRCLVVTVIRLRVVVFLGGLHLPGRVV